MRFHKATDEGSEEVQIEKYKHMLYALFMIMNTVRFVKNKNTRLARLKAVSVNQFDANEYIY